ncbi:SH3 domain-containing protein [Pantanalinema sp. GBBB05]|uniref:SH3 domain-containing protein n=1 Tax=Pantanalinema sp. GBBB05 TaxID=2604139 RepID=UPI001E160B27|nr:SH3 domain-containing protein [Pantanalinema sp. GBBB05]
MATPIWSRSLQVVAGLSIAVTGIHPTIAAPPATETMQLAQLVGQCRQTNQSTPVYETRGGTNPKPVETLAANTKVTLSDNGTSGLIGISSPMNGFIPASNLKLCSGSSGTGTTPPVATGSRCRQVAFPKEGLVIRKSPTMSSAKVGGVGYGERLQLTADPANVNRGADGRNWVEISQPVAGWVSNGYPGRTNLTTCR